MWPLLVEEVFFWSVQRHKSAEKQGECRRTCFRHCGLRWWQIGLLCGEEGAQLAIDTTQVFLLHQDGSASNRMHTTYGTPNSQGEGGRARLVVLVAEVGGPRSGETA